MERWIVLDSEALHVLARPSYNGSAARRASMIAHLATALGAKYIVPTAVLSELYQAKPTDAAIDRVLKQAQTETVGLKRSMARLAGGLRARAQAGSVVDAVVAATGTLQDGTIIATGDPKDLRALACDYSGTQVWSINEKFSGR